MNEIVPGFMPSVDDLKAEQVAGYLRRHPDFFSACPELLQDLAPPVRWTGDTVVDLQRYRVESLKDELAGLRDCAQSVIETSRMNMAIQLRTHAAVLALIAAEDLEHLVRVIAGDLPIFLDVDVAALCLEVDAPDDPGIERDDLRLLPWGTVDTVLGSDQDVRLLPRFEDDGTLFGGTAETVRSAAFARLRAGEARLEGVLALGARREDTFDPRQGTELLQFLAQVIEQCMKRVLPAPA
jgi:hypothetical protein